MYISRPIFKRNYFEASNFWTTEVQNHRLQRYVKYSKNFNTFCRITTFPSERQWKFGYSDSKIGRGLTPYSTLSSTDDNISQANLS